MTSTPMAQEDEFIPNSVLRQAREEGEAVIYGAVDEPDLQDPIRTTFEDSFPDITASVSGFGSSEIASKMVSERRTGNVQSDMVLNSVGTARGVAGQDIYVEVPNDHWLIQQVQEMGYPASFFDPTAGSPPWELPGYGIPYTLLYNTERVSASEAPQEWEALADDRWTGSQGIVMQHPAVLSFTGELFATLYQEWGEEKWAEVVAGIMDNNPQLTPTGSGAYTPLVQGERGISPNLINDLVGQLAEGDDPPLDVTWPEPSMLLSVPIYLTKGARHPNAGMVFASWFLSEEGQQTIGDTGRTPVHPPTASSHALFAAVIPQGVAIQPGGFNNPTYEGANFLTDPDGWLPLFEEHFGTP